MTEQKKKIKKETLVELCDRKAREHEEREKNKQSDERYHAFLLESRPQFKSLGFGYHKGVYYFGTKVFRDGKGYDAVVTSDKKIYINDFRQISRTETEGFNEIRFKFHLNYKEDFHHEPLSSIFSKDAIYKFLRTNTSEVTLENIFSQLVGLFKEKIYFETETKYKILALYRMGGFFMQVWETRARLFIHGDFGAAKSKTTNVLHNTGFNSINLGDWTPAFMQRIIESTGGEIHIDDFESLEEEKQKATIRLIKVGYMKGFKAGKISDIGRKPEVFDLYNTTTVNNVQGLDFITTDRCITLKIPKIANKKYDIETNFSNPLFKEIRDHLYIIGLKEAEKVANEYKKIKSKKLSGRLFSIIKPELTIAKLISDDLFAEVENWWAEEIEQRDNRELADDWEFRGYQRVYEIVVKNRNEDYFQLWGDVVLPLIQDMYNDDEKTIQKQKFRMSAAIGGAFTRNPIFRKRTVNGKTQYKVKAEQLVESLKAKRFLLYIEEVEDGEKEGAVEGSEDVDVLNITVEEVRDTPTASTTTIPSTSSTNSTKNNIKNTKTEINNSISRVGAGLHVKFSSFKETMIKCYGKSHERQMARENDIVEYWSGKLTNVQVYDILEKLSERGEIVSNKAGFWMVL